MHGHQINGSPLGVGAIYGLQETEEKLLLLGDLRQTMINFFPAGTPIFLGGAFNLIAWVSDKNNNNINRRCMTTFGAFINDLQLRDLYLHGRRYTWSNANRHARH